MVKVIVFHLDFPCYQGTDSTKSTVVLIFFGNCYTVFHIILINISNDPALVAGKGHGSDLNFQSYLNDKKPLFKESYMFQIRNKHNMKVFVNPH